LEKLKYGDVVILVGTMGEETEPHDKGRVLGVMRPTDEPVMSMDFNVRKSPKDFENGEYKWPYGLMNLKAWTIPSRPLLKDISTRKFSMDSAQGIVELSAEEVEKVKSYKWNEEALLTPNAHAQARMKKKFGAKSTQAPPPTTTRNGVMHMRRAPAFTYIMRISGGQDNVYKIGWAFDYVKRAKQFNHASMPEIGGLKYSPIWFHLWDTAMQAFKAEQHLLETLKGFRHEKNQEIVIGLSEKEMESAFISTVGKLSTS
jgi:hypothetical protein